MLAFMHGEQRRTRPPQRSPAELPRINRIALVLMVATDVALAIFLVRNIPEGGPSAFEVVAAVLLAAYGLGLTWGWWTIRPRGGRAPYLLVLLPLFAQVCVYAVTWGAGAMDLPSESLATPPWLRELFSVALALGFFVVGPIAGIFSAVVSQRAAPLLVTEVAGPLVFLILVL